MKNNEVIIRIPRDIIDRAIKDLRRPHQFASERIGFFNSTHKILNNNTIIIFITDYFEVDDNDYIDDCEVGARINSTAIRYALQNILDKQSGCFHVHYHSFSEIIPEFSFTDLTDNPELIKSFGHVGRNQIHGMIVLGKNGVNALIKEQGADILTPATKIVIVGYPMIFSFPNNNHRRNSEIYERQSFLGENSQLQLNRVKVGIIGAGGGGSHVIQQLAYLGVTNFVVFDYDVIEKTNLNRMVGAGAKDIGHKKVDIAERDIKNILPNARIIKINDDWVNHPELIQECDFIFGCVDSYVGRRNIELECRRYLIPLIDIGMDIHQIEESPIPNMTGQIILSLPGMPCMNCFGFLTETNLAKETAKYGKAGGRPQVVWSNGILASQAVGTFVDIITGWTGNNNKLVYLAYDGNLGTLIDHPRLKFVSKPCPHFPYSGVGPAKFKSI